jgi:hypothetical protein
MKKTDLAVVLIIAGLVGREVWSLRREGSSYPTGFAVELVILGFAAVVARFGARRLRSGGHATALRYLQALLIIGFAFAAFGGVRGDALRVLVGVSAAACFLSVPIAIWLERRDRR